jgi:hypothetical protein
MQRVRNTLRQNCLLIATLALHPTRLRVYDDKNAVLPRLAHDNRRFMSVQRSFSSDSRAHVCSAVEVTVNFVTDMMSLDTSFGEEILKIDIEAGLVSLAKLYIDDVNVALCKDKCMSILATTRATVAADGAENNNLQD